MPGRPPYPPFPPYPPYPPFPPYPPVCGCCTALEAEAPPSDQPGGAPEQSSFSSSSAEGAPSSSSASAMQGSSSSGGAPPAGSSGSSSVAPPAPGSSSSSVRGGSSSSTGDPLASSSSSSAGAQSSSTSSSAGTPSSSSASSSSSSPSLPPTGQFTVSRIELEAIPGAHKGTGSHTTSKLLVEPSSVIPGNSKLGFVVTDVHITTMLYQIDALEVPNWFGVAIADGVTDFTKPTLYFHPSPSGAGYIAGNNDSVYLGKSKDGSVRTDAESKWRELFQYVDRLGHQLAGAVKLGGATPNQIVILPFMTDGSLLTGGILPDNWFPLFNDILADVRGVITGTFAPLEITELVVAGFSFGFSCVQNFRHSSKQDHAHLDPRMKQIWDFDGAPKTVSDPVVSVPGKFKAIKYSEGSETQSLILPAPRWVNCPTPPPDEEPPLKPKTDVHHMIRDFMFLDAACQRDKP